MKYRMTPAGYNEFTGNRKRYSVASVEAKIMTLMSSRVGYSLDSILSQVMLDPALRAKQGQVISIIDRLKSQKFIEVIG